MSIQSCICFTDSVYLDLASALLRPSPSLASVAPDLLAHSDLPCLCVLRESLRDARRMRTRLPFLARHALHPSAPPATAAAPLCGPSRAASTSAATEPRHAPSASPQQPRPRRRSDARESALERALADNFLRSGARLPGGSTGSSKGSDDASQADERVARAPGSLGSRRDGPLPSSKNSGAGGSLDACKGQAGWSTEKKPTPTPRQRPTTPSEPVWPPPTSLRDAFLQQPAPSSPVELLQLLQRARAIYRPLDLEALAHFHASAAVSPFVSTASYRFLLKLAFDHSNLRLARALLSEMEEKEVAMDEATQRVVVQGYLARSELGPDDERRKQAAMRALRVNPSLAPQVPRRDFGEKAAGSADPRERWKGWAITNRQRREMEALRTQQEEDARRVAEAEAWQALPPHLRSRRERRAVSLGRPAASRPPRPPLIVPRDAHRLDRYAITALVQRLVREDRVSDGFALARSWLTANKPHLDSNTHAAPTRETSSSAPPPRIDDTPPHVRQYLQQCTLYHSTSRVLMNILVKALFLEKAPRTVIRDFITTFIATHSAGPPARPNLPGIETLRLLVSGLRGAPHAWSRAISYIDWFGYRWGIPKADPCDRRRHHFVLPSPAVAVGLGLADSSGKPLGPFANKPYASQLLSLAPHHLVTPDLAVLLLRHAVESHKHRWLGEGTKRAINKWWHGLDKRGSEIWTTYETKGLVKRAVKAGLIVEDKRGGEASGEAKTETDGAS